MRATVRIDGSVGPPRHPSLLLTARVQFVAGSAAVRVAVTLRNIKRAHHHGGIWELGDAGSVYLRDVSLRLAIAGRHHARRLRAGARGGPAVAGRCRWSSTRIQAAASNWQHRRARRSARRDSVHLPRLPPAERRPPRRRAAGDAAADGARTPRAWSASRSSISGRTGRRPLRSSPTRSIWRLFPGHTRERTRAAGRRTEDAPLHADLRRRCVLAGRAVLGPGPASARRRRRGIARAAPPARLHVRRTRCGISSWSTPPSRVPIRCERKREAIDEYGWRHFGDLYADHENAFSGLADADGVALQQPVRRHCRFRAAVHALGRLALARDDERAGVRTSPTSTSTTPIATRAPTTTGCSGTRRIT